MNDYAAVRVKDGGNSCKNESGKLIKIRSHAETAIDKVDYAFEADASCEHLFNKMIINLSKIIIDIIFLCRFIILISKYILI